MDYKIKQIPEDFAVEEIPAVKDEGQGDYPYFWLEKRNHNTLRAVKIVADKLKTGIKRIGWAGNKDKNAVTKQLISIQGITREKAEQEIASNISLKYYGRGSNRIYVGNLLGNKFAVTVRDLGSRGVAAIEENYRQLQRNGFLIPNYFDEQRFGGSNVETGRALLRRDFEKAAEEIYRKKVADPVKEIRKVHGSTLSLYIHAYQSLMFNETLSEYIRRNCSSFSEANYSKGTFLFPKEKIANTAIPVIGFGTELEGELGKTAAEILKKHELTQRDFVIRQLPGLSVEGAERKAFVQAASMHIGRFEEDELNSGKKKCRVSFELPKGSYATIVIKALCS